VRELVTREQIARRTASLGSDASQATFQGTLMDHRALYAARQIRLHRSSWLAAPCLASCF